MINLQFESAALPADTFQVLKFDGEEKMSHLFRFELHLVSRDPDIDFEKLLESRAFLAITTQDKTRYVHGMLSEFEQGGEWHSGLYEYHAVLVPRLWMMSQSTQNQIFQNQTVPDIIESELGSIRQKGGHPLTIAGLTTADYEIYTIRNYNDREYVVQYKETDLNFISRLMEHEGIYYFFEHDEEGEKIVITDATASEEDPDQSYVMFQTSEAASLYDRSVIYKLSRSQKQIPGSVLLNDFNYRTPALPMHVEGDVSTDGIGFVNEFGAHFKTPEEGEELAAIRAEEYRCAQNIYSGESNIAGFACGGMYTLAQHFRNEYNRGYMLTKVKHHGSQDIESWGNVGGTSYHNQFSCIPSDLQYRPQRLTPRPKLYGIMNGTIDSEQDMNRADIDEQGRYKVMMPFDISGTAPGKASRRIRMAQPYGGGGTGMSFPLLKGTEVIWTCIDGDIDRPIITGAVPNPLNPSVTITENHTSNMLKTASGIVMGFNDGFGKAGQTSSGSDGSLQSQQQGQSIGLKSQPLDLLPQNSAVKLSKQKSSLNHANQPLEQQQQMADDYNLAGSNASSGANYNFTGTGKNFCIAVPDYEEAGNTGGSKDSFLRMGMPCDDESSASTDLHFNKAGITSYTDGDYVSIVKGQTYTHNAANSSTLTTGTKYSYGISRSLDYSLSNKFSSAMGISGSANTGLSVATSVGVTASMALGMDFKFGVGKTLSFVKDSSISVSKSQKFDVDERFWAKLDPPEGATGWLEKTMENDVPGIAAGLAVASSASSAAITTCAQTLTDADGTDVLNGFAEAHAGAVYLAGASLSTLALAYAVSKSSQSDEPLAELDLNKTGNYAKLQIQKNAETKMHLRATTEFDKEDKASCINLTNTAAKAMINIKAANTESGTIDLEGGAAGEGKITLSVGNSSIVITDEGIEFKAGGAILDLKEGQGLDLKGSKGLKVADGDIVLEKGDIKASNGNVSASKKLDGGGLITRALKAGQ